MVTLATIATSTAGSTAIIENRLTIWTCSLAAARPRRRACTTLPDFADDDADQQQDGRGIDQQEGVDHVALRLDRGQPRQHHEGQERRQQRDGRPQTAPAIAAGNNPSVRASDGSS